MPLQPALAQHRSAAVPVAMRKVVKALGLDKQTLLPRKYLIVRLVAAASVWMGCGCIADGLVSE